MVVPKLSPELSIAKGIPLEEQPGIGPLTISGYLREVVRRHGPHEALVIHSGELRIAWTYDELLERALAVARSLIASGVGKNGRVAILMTNRPEFVAALFGTVLAGGVPVPLSTFSTGPELDQLLRASEVSVLLFEQLVVDKNFADLLIQLEPAIGTAAPSNLASAKYPYLKHLVRVGPLHPDGDAEGPRRDGAIESWQVFLQRGDAIAEAQVLARADAVTPGDIGGIFFSSGTTSTPKGIIHAQRAFAIQWWRWSWMMATTSRVRVWTGNGLFWSANAVMVLGIALSTGGAIVLQRYFDAEEALKLVEAEKVSFLQGRPHQWARLQAAPNWAATDLSTVKFITRGELIREHPTVDTDWEVPMAFGTTETMTLCTGFPADTPRNECLGSCGAPFPGNTLKIIDPLTAEVKPLREPGEMCIKGPTLMMGYIGKTPEACFDSEGFYRTGDGGWLDEQGRFFWEGRLTSMIKTGGANVSPEEVDEAIRRFPGIKRSQTVGLPDDLLGEMVVACVVPIEDIALSRDEITAFLKKHLASFKVPRRILFVRDEDIRFTGSGKIKLHELRSLAIQKLISETKI
ncbi:MAG: class I adenylate-forming enzyme family protein [Novosphingobium sp.]